MINANAAFIPDLPNINRKASDKNLLIHLCIDFAINLQEK
jgi:hypothetical protein